MPKQTNDNNQDDGSVPASEVTIDIKAEDIE